MSEGFYLKITQDHGPTNSKGVELKKLHTFFDTREGADVTEYQKANDTIAEALREYGPATRVEIEIIPKLVRPEDIPQVEITTDENGRQTATIAAVSVTKGENV